MAYIVNKTDGSVVATVADGTIETTKTSITLLGKGFNNYGEIVAEDWVKMIEHFAFGAPPTAALRGQLWFDTQDDILRLNTSETFGTPKWNTLGNAFVQATVPSTTTISPDYRSVAPGTFWYDDVNDVLNITKDGVTFSPVKSVQSGTLPTTPEEGDLFYDTTTKELKVFNSALPAPSTPFEDSLGNPIPGNFDVVGPARYEGPTPPVTGTQQDGDQWWNTDTKQLFMFDDNDSSYRLIGPLTPSGFSAAPIGAGKTTGNIPFSGAETLNNAVQLVVVDGDIVGIWSRADFAPPGPIVLSNNDYPTIVPLAESPWRFHHEDDVDVDVLAIERGLNLSTINSGSTGVTGDGNNGSITVYKGTATQAQYT